MKVIIAGGRDYWLTASDHNRINELHAKTAITEVVSGGATGADQGGESWSKLHGVKLKMFPANWNAHGRAAGPIRNRAMAEYADMLVAFPGGKGTADMVRQMERLGKPVVKIGGK